MSPTHCAWLHPGAAARDTRCSNKTAHKGGKRDKMTVYEFAKKCMDDSEINAGGIVTNERKYLDAVGFTYTVKGGSVQCIGDDAEEF